MLSDIWRRFRERNRPIATRGDMAAFLEERAAQVAQKSVIGYCHVKTQLPLVELMRDKPFADAFEVSRWEAFAAVLADLVVVTEGLLRPAAEARAPRLVEPLTAVFADVLAHHPVPAHRPGGWADAIESLRVRLARAQIAQPLPFATVAETSAERLFETLPIHPRLREPDKPAIVANVRFLMVGLRHQFDRRLDPAALVDALLSDGPSASMPV
ncbi:MAG TPA: hypothetical protein VLG66_18360 [Alphaproteobacteria bacterium]|jgi:hypothetical protein|nr:hypothetical protein [Alphaproteobacteria bacterium]